VVEDGRLTTLDLRQALSTAQRLVTELMA